MLSSASAPARAVERAVRHGQLLASSATTRELATRLLSPHFDRYVSREHRDSLLRSLAPLVEVIEIVRLVRVCRDPDDDRFLEVALRTGQGSSSAVTAICSPCIRFVELRF